MYVCVCHGIRCRDVRAVAKTGRCRAADVFRHFDAKPQCGICVATMKAMLKAGAVETMQAEGGTAATGG